MWDVWFDGQIVCFNIEHPSIINKIIFLLQFTWKDGEGAQITEGMTSETEEIENTKRITAISTLKLTVKKTYHNKNITCEAMQANTF